MNTAMVRKASKGRIRYAWSDRDGSLYVLWEDEGR